jgi:hypothetical protein
MSDLVKVLDYLYSRFILRDFLAKAVPGALVLGSCALLWWDLKTILGGLGKLPIYTYVLLYGIAFVTGFGIQAIGTFSWVVTLRPRCERLKDTLARLNTFRERATDKQQQQHERFVVLKEMTGNTAVALLIGIIIHGRFACWCEPRDWGIALLAMIAVPVLLLEHYRQSRQQTLWEKIVLYIENNDQPPFSETFAHNFCRAMRCLTKCFRPIAHSDG